MYYDACIQLGNVNQIWRLDQRQRKYMENYRRLRCIRKLKFGAKTKFNYRMYIYIFRMCQFHFYVASYISVINECLKECLT